MFCQSSAQMFERRCRQVKLSLGRSSEILQQIQKDFTKYKPRRVANHGLTIGRYVCQCSTHMLRISRSISLSFKKVIGETTYDFFEMYNKLDYDIIISNPPFSIKQKIFTKLKEINKPFILIVPVSIITKKYFMDNFKDDFQIIIPKKRIQFIKDEVQTKRCWFDCVYIAYKINLEKDITFIS